MASNRAMDRHPSAQLAARVPPAARVDLLEWDPEKTVEAQFALMLRGEIALRQLIDGDTNAPVLTDDRPVNEYYFLRESLGKFQATLRRCQPNKDVSL